LGCRCCCHTKQTTRVQQSVRFNDNLFSELGQRIVFC
jgi:primosomal protein N''